MNIIIVSADDETLTLTLVKSKERLEEARALAVAENERLFEHLINLDPDDEDLSTDEQVETQFKLDRIEQSCDRQWLRYEKALVRYGYDVAAAQKAGLIK